MAAMNNETANDMAESKPELSPAFGGSLQPEPHKQQTKFANAAPLGLSAFALPTFILSLINIRTRGVTTPSIVLAAAFGYGGLVQLLAGMWEMASGNTFGATALSSFGGFWISVGIILTPGGFEIMSTYETAGQSFDYAFGFFFFGWFIFCFILVICSIRSTVAFFSIFFFLDITFLLLGIAYSNGPNPSTPQTPTLKAAGYFGLCSAFAAWYNALAGIMDSSNFFFTLPVVHFPWSETGSALRKASKSQRQID